MEAAEAQLRFLREQINERLKELTSKVDYYRRRHWWRQMIAVFLSAAITVVAGMKSMLFFQKEYVSDIVLVLGACSTVWSAMSAHFAPKESWHLSVEIQGYLRALKARLEFEELSPNFASRQEAIVKELFEKYQSILADYNVKWSQLRNKAS